MKFLELESSLFIRKQQDLMRLRRNVNSPQQSQIVVDGKKLVNFASNDYLGLANNLDAIKSLNQTASEFGFGSGASHLICGHQQPHQDLEKALARFVRREAALTFASGYMANLAILQSLAKKGDLIIADKLNHASLIDGVKLSAADSRRYSHCDMAALDKRLATSSANSSANKFVVTDAVFSMDGDIAPLKEMVRLCDKYHAILIIDDAHGFGVLGESGRGSCDYFGLTTKQVPIVMATLGKAIGGYGAFVAGEQVLIDYLTQFARSYIYTTAMPALIASGNLTNLKTLEQQPEIVNQLFDNIDYFKKTCQQNSIELMPSITAIQPLLIGDNEKLLKVNESLLENGFLVGAIRPPTVPENSGRLRITLSAKHTQAQIDGLIDALKNALLNT